MPDIYDQIAEEIHEDFRALADDAESKGRQETPRQPPRINHTRHCTDCGGELPTQAWERCEACEQDYQAHMRRARKWNETRYQRYLDEHRD